MDAVPVVITGSLGELDVRRHEVLVVLGDNAICIAQRNESSIRRNTKRALNVVGVGEDRLDGGNMVRDKRLALVVPGSVDNPTGATAIMKTTGATIAKEHARDAPVVRLTQATRGVVELMLEMHICKAPPHAMRCS